MCSNLSYKYFFDVLQFCEAEFLGFGGCLFYIAFVELLCTDVIVDYLWERFIWTFHEKLPLPLGRPCYSWRYCLLFAVKYSFSGHRS